MENSFYRFLSFFRLVDENGELSITNIAVWVVLGKVAYAPDISMTEIAALLTVIGSYRYKSFYVAKKTKHKETELLGITNTIETAVKELGDLKAKFDDFKTAQIFKR